LRKSAKVASANRGQCGGMAAVVGGGGAQPAAAQERLVLLWQAACSRWPAREDKGGRRGPEAAALAALLSSHRYQ